MTRVNYRFPFFLGRNRATFRIPFSISNRQRAMHEKSSTTFYLWPRYIGRKYSHSRLTLRRIEGKMMRIEKNTRNFCLGNLFGNVEISRIAVGYISVMMMEVFDGGELLKMFWKDFLDFFPSRTRVLHIFPNIFVEMFVKKLATIRKMVVDVPVDVGPFILENIDARISWLMINVWWMFFLCIYVPVVFRKRLSFIVSNEYAFFFRFLF